MNVDRTSFNALLPTILKHISNSYFIAFDLELSGIPTQRRREFSGKQNIQQRYQELKRAAEKFHILQIGLTCVEQDLESKKYVLRAYNFNLSPLVAFGLDIEREFTFSTGAVDFLLNHGYQMDAPYRLGVPYLTRSETVEAERRAKLQWDRTAIPDIKIDPGDEQALAFMQLVRDDIGAWQKSPKRETEECLIGGLQSSHSEDSEVKTPLNRFQRRLVHQIVRSEYPNLSTSSRGDYVQVHKKDVQEQTSQSNSIQRRIADSTFLQIGFRWVAEAMVGGDLSGINAHLCGPRVAGEPDQPDSRQFARRLKELATAAKERKKILVGHNCFLDLVYFYQTFIGDLPETVEEFQAAIHEIFSLVLDTKYIATARPGGETFKSSQLWQIDETLSEFAEPIIEMPTDHPEYTNPEQYHEAGFDSFATAKVFLRLAAQLSTDENSHHTNFVENHTPQDVNGHDKNSKNAQSNVSSSLDSATDGKKPNESIKKTKSKSKSTAAFKNRFSSTNVFDQLRNMRDDDRVLVSAETPVSSSKATALGAKNDGALLEAISEKQQRSKLIPGWDSDLWKTYGNKLRVYGTVEEMCDLCGENDAAVGKAEAGETSPTTKPAERRPSLLASLVEKCKSLVI